TGEPNSRALRTMPSNPGQMRQSMARSQSGTDSSITTRGPCRAMQWRMWHKSQQDKQRPKPSQTQQESIGQSFAIASSRFVHEFAHSTDARVKASKDRLADQEMADVQLSDLRDRGDRNDIVESQPVTRVRLDGVLDGQSRAIADALQFG